MKFNPLGKTDIYLSAIGFGTVQLRMIPEKQAVETLKRGFELGINWVQTAPEYGGCERIVARAIRESGRDVMVLNLVAGRMADFARTFEATCRFTEKKRLEMFGVSCIDDAEHLNMNVWGKGGMVAFLMEKKAQGRLGALVCSTHSSPDFVAALIRKNVFDGIMLAYNPLGFHLNSYFEASEGRVHEDLLKNRTEIFPLARENGVGLLVMKALAGGLLYPGKAIEPREWLPGEKPPLTPPDILAGILSCPGVCAVIPGMASVEEVVENAGAVSQPHFPAEGSIERVEQAAARLTRSLCSRCGACEPSCSQSLRISMLLRDAYFWIYRTKTAETIDRLHYFALHPKEELACLTCTERTCACPHGIDIPEHLGRVHDWMVKLRKQKILPPPPERQAEELVNGKYPALVLSREVPEEISTGENFVCRFWLQNAGREKWAVADPAHKAVIMGVFYQKKLIAKAGLREDVDIGMRTHFSVMIDSFARPGRYDLDFRLTPLSGDHSRERSTRIFNTRLTVKGFRRFPRLSLKPVKKLVMRLKLRNPAGLVLASSLFDPAFYLRSNPDLALTEDAALRQFLTRGWKENRNPHPLFDVSFYLKQNPDVAARRINPLVHFITFGWREGRNPHPLFDTAYYLARYPDVADCGINPLSHFMDWGRLEKRDPHPLFDTAFYLSKYKDVSDSHLNPLAHYVEYGWAEQRDPNFMFNSAHYLKEALDARDKNPLSHYVQQGWKQGKDPHPNFSTKAYLKRFPNLTRERINPLAHYLGNLPACGVTYRSHNIPARLPAGSVFSAKLVLENTGARTWIMKEENGKNTVLMVSWDGKHAANHPLPVSHVFPREQTFLVFPLNVPPDAGRHTVQLELVELNVARFRENGVMPLEIELEAEESKPDLNQKTYHLARRINPWYYQPTQGISRGADGGSYPLFISRARGCHSWDLEDKKYIDYLMGYGSVLLGYNDPRIRDAIAGVLDINALSPFPHPLEMAVSRMLTEDIPSAEMVVFGKNGSDVCTLAARMSRLYTGKKHILCCGYQGWQDFWVEQFGFGQTGVPDRPECLIHPFKFNDQGDFFRLFGAHKNDLAAVMIEPSGPWGGEFAGHEPDIDPEFLGLLREETQQSGAILVYDEIVTGFRYPGGSVQKKTGVLPDLTCLGKAMASGMPLAALAGRAEIFQRCMGNAWYCPTFKGEILSFAAAKAAMDIYRQEPVSQHIWNYGRKLKAGIHAICDAVKLDAGCKGPPFRMALTFNEPDMDTHRMKRTLLQQELLKKGIITLNGVMLPSTSHNDPILEETLDIIGNALEMVATAERGNRFDRYIEIPVF